MTRGALTRRHAEVEARQPFRATNLYAKYVGQFYVVFSYREDWPIFLYDPAHGWFENMDWYSATTSRHIGSSRPLGVTTLKSTREEMLARISGQVLTP